MQHIVANRWEQKYLEKFFLLLAVFLFRLALDVFYYIFCKQYAYFGLSWAPQSDGMFVFSYLWMILPFLFLPQHSSRPSYLLFCCLCFFQWIPVSVLFAGDCQSAFPAFIGLGLAYCLLAASMHIRFPGSMGGLRIQLSEKLFAYGLIALGIIVCALLLSHYGFQFHWSSVDDMYEVRDEFKNNSGRLFTYLFTWFAYAINPMLFLWSFHRRKWGICLTALIMQVYLFSIGGHKAVILLFPFLIIIYYLMRYFQRIFLLSLATALVIYILYQLYHDHFSYPVSLPSSVVFWRGLVMPAQLYYDYFDFFKNHQVDHFAQSFPFDQFSSSIYDRKVALIIGDMYLIPGRNINANANFWADLFINIGYLSFLIGTLFLFVFFAIIDWFAHRKSYLIVIPFISTSLIGLLNGPFIANLITNGMLIMLVMIALLPSESKENQEFK